MAAPTLAILLALASGAFFAVAAALQHQAAAGEEEHRLGDPRLVVRLARSPRWLVANGADLAAIALQALALRVGQLALVQPMLVSGLILTVPVQAALTRGRIRPRQLAGAALGTAALGLFLVAAATGPDTHVPSSGEWMAAALVVGLVTAGCLVASGAVPKGPGRAALLGAGTGALYGFASALLKVCSERLDEPLTLLTDWHAYALVAVGVVGFVLNQNVFQHGTLAAGIVALSIAEPVVAFVLGVTIFGEHVAASPAHLVMLALSLLGLLPAIWLSASEAETSRSDRQLV